MNIYAEFYFLDIEVGTGRYKIPHFKFFAVIVSQSLVYEYLVLKYLKILRIEKSSTFFVLKRT